MLGKYDNDNINAEIRIILAAHIPLDTALKAIVELTFQTTPADYISIFLKEGDQLICKLAQGRKCDASEELRVEACRASIEKAVNDKSLSLESCETIDAYLLPPTSPTSTQEPSIVAVPLLFDLEKFGFIYVSIQPPSKFALEHLDTLKTIASLASIKVGNALMFGGPARNRWLLEDIKLASKVQKRLQPNVPKIEGWDIVGASLPMFEVGGDYYDFIRREDGLIVITLGDIAGKGLSAALLMVLLHTTVHVQSRMRDHTDEVLDEINRHFYAHTPSERFATLFYTFLDPKSSVLTYSNAGHLPSLLIRRSGEILKLEEAGLPVGAFPGAVYTEGKVIFKPGDMLVIYSDGITEQVNERGDEFGEEQLIEIIRRNLGASAPDLYSHIEEARRIFAGTVEAVDDMTIVIVKKADA